MNKRTAMWRPCILGAVWFAVSALADAPELTPAALEQQAQAELARVSRAVQERLEHEAAGDLVGARVAAEEAENHRYRFLDLKRESALLSSSAPARSPVEAARSPFSPDPSFTQRSNGRVGASVSVSARGSVPRFEVNFAPWDMYRPREPARRPPARNAPTEAAASRTSSNTLVERGFSDPDSVAHVGAPEISDAAAQMPTTKVGMDEVLHEPLRVYREDLQAHARDYVGQGTAVGIVARSRQSGF